MSEEKAKSIVDAIRKALNDGGQGGGGTPQEILLVPKGGKKLVRFLTEFIDGLPIVMHDQFQVLYPQPCLQYYEMECPFHGDKWRQTTHYAFTVWDYESQSKRIAMWKSTLSTPMESLLKAWDRNGTIKDRDWELEKSGTGTKSHTSAVGLDKSPYTGPADMQFSKERVMEIVKGMIQAKTIDELKKKE